MVNRLDRHWLDCIAIGCLSNSLRLNLLFLPPSNTFPLGHANFVFQVEAAYDMLLMQRLSQRRAGKVASSNIRYADVKPISTGTGVMPEWLQKTLKNIPLSVESPSTRNLGIQAGVYGALMVFTFVSGSTPTSSGPYTGADVPGLILATSFGASLYFLSQKKIGLGKQLLGAFLSFPFQLNVLLYICCKILSG